MPHRIVVVDHTPDILELLSLALTDEGYQVLTLGYSREVCQDLLRFQPDLILLDFIPHRKRLAWAVFRALKRSPATRTLPIILMTTGDVQTLELRSALTFEGVQVLNKPFDLETLFTVIRQMLSAQTQ